MRHHLAGAKANTKTRIFHDRTTSLILQIFEYEPPASMGRGKELTPQMRSRICELKKAGLSQPKIKQLHPEIPLGTIKSTLRREALRVNNVTRPRSGQPRKLNEEERDHIHDLTTENPHIKIRDLLAEVDHKVKKRSIQRLLHEMGHGKQLQLNVQKYFHTMLNNVLDEQRNTKN
jgi:transposase